LLIAVLGEKHAPVKYRIRQLRISARCKFILTLHPLPPRSFL